MYRDGISHVQLRQQIRRIYAGAVVKLYGDQLSGGIDLPDHAHVAVEDPGAHGAILFFPNRIIVVPGLHDPVPLAEHHVAPRFLVLARSGRIQRRL